MKCLLSVLLCLTCVLGDEPQGYYGPPMNHGTTVCIEIRPSPHSNPTKVCGPVVHGGPVRPVQKSAEPTVYNIPSSGPQSIESDESREAGAPCGPGQKAPTYQSRQQPPPQLFQYMPRMDMPPEGMMPLMPMEFDSSGLRQGSPPCATNQRPPGPMPMPYQNPMMAPQLRPPPMSIAQSRAWMVPPQQAMMAREEAMQSQRAAEEAKLSQRAAEEAKQSQKAAEEASKPSGPTSKMESLENLLKECEEKTKLLQEKEAKITELKSQIGNGKKEPEHHDNNSSSNEPK